MRSQMYPVAMSGLLNEKRAAGLIQLIDISLRGQIG